MPNALDPVAWLAGHDPGAAQADPFSFSDDVLQVGADELAAAGGDLSRALADSPDCRAEIILAWLDTQAHERGPAAAADGVMLAARIIGRLNAGGGGQAGAPLNPHKVI